MTEEDMVNELVKISRTLRSFPAPAQSVVQTKTVIAGSTEHMYLLATKWVPVAYESLARELPGGTVHVDTIIIMNRSSDLNEAIAKFLMDTHKVDVYAADRLLAEEDGA